MADQTASLLRELPSINRLLNHARGAALLTRYNRDYVTQKCRDALHIGLIAGENPATGKANSKARPPWSKAWGDKTLSARLAAHNSAILDAVKGCWL